MLRIALRRLGDGLTHTHLLPTTLLPCPFALVTFRDRNLKAGSALVLGALQVGASKQLHDGIVIESLPRIPPHLGLDLPPQRIDICRQLMSNDMGFNP